jgi:hypothetical protein
MRLIFSFIAGYLACLWDGAWFQITASESSSSNGGDGYLVVESSVLRLRFVCDRQQLFLDFQPAWSDRTKWYSNDLVRRMFTRERERSAVLDESYAQFVCDNLQEIERRFDRSNWDETESTLKALQRKRDKERFG